MFLQRMEQTYNYLKIFVAL